MNSINDKNPNSLSSQQRVLLLQSISQFFQLNGFSKTLKYFLKEAQIEKDGEGVCSLNIEEMCYEYLKSRNDAKEEAKATEMEANQGKKSEPTPENGVLDGAEVKSKKSKKSKSAKDCSEQVIIRTQPKPADYPEETPSSLPSAPAKKSKDKKKKHKDELEDLQEKPSEIVEHNVEKKEKKEKKVKKEKNGSSKKEENVEVPSGTTEAGERKKESKKRKKPSSEENDAGCVEEPTLHDSKRSKTDKSEQSNGLVQPPKTPNGSANGVFEKAGAEKSQKEDKIKELNGSAEPKTAKAAFQRVKAEDVEFADERLQDNSYWAKDGADSGYGAKAQEVLGQVRGRDFRHEKTKKKRGSYRGGQIDLHTHSVKFNYKDEDE